MNKKEALLLCMDHWKWMADTGCRHTNDYFYRGGHTGRHPSNYCYCCEYTDQQGISCVQCPLKGYAWVNNCLEKGSTYDLWFHSNTDEERRRLATLMNDACIEAIKNYNPNEVPYYELDGN